MSTLGLTAIAFQDDEWQEAWNDLGEGLRARLTARGLASPLIWAGLRGDRGKLQSVLSGLGVLSVDAAKHTDELTQCLGLQQAAKSPGERWVEGTARLSNLQLAAEVGAAEKKRRVDEQAKILTKLQATAVARKPAEWKGRKYQRADAAGDENARKKTEARDRDRWMRRVFTLLLNTDLPFGVEAAAKGWSHDSADAARCYRGLRAATLKKRVSDVGPFLRFLQAETGKRFPNSVSDVLRYFAVRQAEEAARSVYGTLLTALGFFEEAGELPKELRLSNTPALQGAAKEFEAKRRLLAEQRGEPTARKQAPPMLLSVLAAVEKVVLDETVPMYIRGYAWYRLLRHWASLRFSDTGGLPPSTVIRRARGISGTLTHTKTTGADKSTAVLPIFVSKEAWIESEWLESGWALWQEEAMGFPRDYFLPLPAADFSGVVYKRARYSDAVGFSKALLGMLLDDEGNKLLLPEALCFWSEHSDRAGLDSWLAGLAVGADTRRFVGRWATKGSEDGYVRSALRVVENCQRLAAVHARAAHSGGADYFGEEETLRQLRDCLLAQGVDEEEVEKQIAKLSRARPELDPTPFGVISQGGVFKSHVPEPPQSSESSLPPLLDLALNEAGELPGEGPREDELTAENDEAEMDLAKLADQLVEDELAKPAGFVISVTRGGACRRLHFAGGCWRNAGEHYRRFIDYGQAPPAEEAYTHRCKDCFPAGRPAVAAAEAEIEASCSSGSSSSASSGASAAPSPAED
jgi:hypothetical protein